MKIGISRLLVAALAAALLAACSSGGSGKDVNLNPGLWEMETTMNLFGQEMTETDQQCVTAEELADANTLFDLDDLDADCSIVKESRSSSRLQLTMSCEDSGMNIHIEMDARFKGDRLESTMVTRMDTPMGEFETTVESRGRRIGDC